MLATYYQYWRINLLTMIEYRANFFMWFGFTVVYHATAIAALWVTLANFPSRTNSGTLPTVKKKVL